MNNTTRIQQKSRDFLEFFQTRGNSERLSDNSIASPIEVALSRIAVNFGLNCQNDANFAARVGLGAVQKIDFLGGVA